jgi:hypothetical protein
VADRAGFVERVETAQGRPQPLGAGFERGDVREPGALADRAPYGDVGVRELAKPAGLGERLRAPNIETDLEAIVDDGGDGRLTCR